jgi:hypothetical protein
MPPTRSGAAHLSVITSVVAVTGAAVFAAADAAVLAIEPAVRNIFLVAAIGGAGYIVREMAAHLITMRDMTIKTHDGLFHPERGVLHLIALHADRADEHEARAARHSGEIKMHGAALRASDILRD